MNQYNIGVRTFYFRLAKNQYFFKKKNRQNRRKHFLYNYYYCVYLLRVGGGFVLNIIRI